MISTYIRNCAFAAGALVATTFSAGAVPISATFSGILEAEAVDPYMASMYGGMPEFHFDGATYEITIHGDDATGPNYTSQYRGSSQKYDFTRFDVTVDVSIVKGSNTVNVVGQAAQISFYNFLNSSPWSDIVSMGLSATTGGGSNVNVGLNVVSQAAENVIWTTDGYINSLSALTDSNFDPLGVVRGTLSDYSDNYANYKTGSLTAGPASALSSTAPVPLPAGGVLLLSALGGVAVIRRRRKV